MSSAAVKREALTIRLRRLGVISQRVNAIAGRLNEEFPTAPSSLVLRPGYAYQEIPSGGSSRSAPPRENRPPATRILTSRGAALRLHLTMMVVAQATSPPGRVPKLDLPLDGGKGLGWVQLLVTGSEDQRVGEYHLTYMDKKVRSAQSALHRLRQSGLVRLPRLGERRGRYDEAQLWDEEGISADGRDPVPYQVPIAGQEPTFTLPAALFQKGWIHVLEDSELAVLLMLYCGRGRFHGEPGIAIPADTRTQHYGLSQPAYGSYSILADLGLLTYDGMARNSDGTIADFESKLPLLTRFNLIPEGLKQDPVKRLTAVLKDRLLAT